MTEILTDLFEKRDNAKTKLDWLILDDIIQQLIERMLFNNTVLYVK